MSETPLAADFDPKAMVNNATDLINDANTDDGSFIPQLQYQHVQAQSQLLLVAAVELTRIRELLEQQQASAD